MNLLPTGEPLTHSIPLTLELSTQELQVFNHAYNNLDVDLMWNVYGKSFSNDAIDNTFHAGCCKTQPLPSLLFIYPNLVPLRMIGAIDLDLEISLFWKKSLSYIMFLSMFSPSSMVGITIFTIAVSFLAEVA